VIVWDLRFALTWKSCETLAAKSHSERAVCRQAARYNEAMPPRSEKSSSPPQPSVSDSSVAPLTTKSFEKGLEELEEIVRNLERGELSLEDSILLFEKGMSLSNTCRQQLEEAETRVELLIRKGGKMSPEPFGTEAPARNAGPAKSTESPSKASTTPSVETDSETADDDDIPF
jgi:exodeoxyribonuclease VII small subunit